MRSVAFAALALVLAATPAPAQSGKRPRDEHTSEPGRFRVRTPAKLKTETKDLVVPGLAQPIPLTTERGEASSGAVYAVTWADYPDSYKDVPARTILDGVRDGLKGSDGTVKQDRDVLLDGPEKLTGRELRIEAGNKVIRARVFLHGTRLYQVMVTGNKETAAGPASDAFLQSFELLK